MNPNVEHFDEMTALLYAEGELDSAQRGSISAHASECSVCRSLLGTLSQESQLLGQALLEEDPLPARFTAGPAGTLRHIAPWAWALSFGVVGAAGYVAWTAILSPWADQLETIGIGSTNFLATMFFAAAFWEGWKPMLDTLQYAMLLTVGIGALLALRRHWHRRPIVTAILTCLTLFLVSPGSSTAAEIRRGTSANVAESEVVHNDVIAAGSSLRVDGTVDGDFIAFGENVTVNGHVTGDVIVFSENVRIAGAVDGNVRCFCASLMLEGPVGKNVSIFASDAQIDRKSTIGGGVIAFAGNIVADGKVARDLLFFAGGTALNGNVGGDVRLRGGKLVIGPAAQVAGIVHVISDGKPEVAASAKLGRPLEFDYRPARTGYRSWQIAIGFILRYAAAFLLGLLLITVLPGLFGAGMRAARQASLAMGVGAIILICGCALAIFSVLLLLAGVGAGIVTVFLLVPIVYGAQVFVGTWIGEQLLGGTIVARATLVRLALGLLLLHLAEIVPVLGWLVLLAAGIWGTGALSIALWHLLRPEAHSATPPAFSS